MDRAITKPQELSLVNPLKTVAMLLIVLYHCCVFWMPGWSFVVPPQQGSSMLGVFAAWLNTVHVPVFMFLSGYIYGMLKHETHRYDSGVAVIKKKNARLLVPYAFVSLIWAAPSSAVLLGMDGLAQRFLFATAPSQLWFIVALFDLFVLAELFNRPIARLLSRPVPLFVLSLVLYAIGVMIDGIIGSYFQVSIALQYAPIFIAGIVARSADLSCFWRRQPLVWIVVDLALYLGWRISGISSDPFCRVLTTALLPFVRLAGIAAFCSVLGWLFTTRPSFMPSKVLQKQSFGIYLFHQQIIYCVFMVVNGIGAAPIAIVALCFVISLGVSYGIAILFGRFALTRRFIGM